MGLFSKKKKKEAAVKICFTTTSDLLGEIEGLASRFMIEENLLDTYSDNKLDIENLNKARLVLEEQLVNLGKELSQFYSNEYESVMNSENEHNIFSYSLYGMMELFNNSLDLYSSEPEVRDSLNIAYDNCNKSLEKIKELLSDDEAIIAFTGLTPVEIAVEEEKVEEEIEEIEENDDEIDDTSNSEKDFSIEDENNIIVDDEDDIDGDLIINTDNMKVYFIRTSRNEYEEINLNLCIKNKSDKDVVIQFKDVTVDGTSTQVRLNCGINAGKIVYDSIIFKNDIQQLVNLNGTFCMIESGEVIEEEMISLFKED